MKQNALGTDKIWPLVLKLIIPAMLAQFVNVIYSITDRIFVANIPGIGQTALSGLGICVPIVSLVSSFTFLFGLGGGPLAAQFLGEKRKDKAEKVLGNCFLALVIISILVSVAFLIFKTPLLYAFGATSENFTYASDYLTIYLWGSIFAILSLGLNTFITCQGFSKMGMITIVIGAIINTILDPLFIYGLNMGVKGAAYATIIAQAVSMIWIIIFLTGKKTNIKIKLGNYDFKTIFKVMKLGFSPFIIIMTDSVILIITNTVISKYYGANAAFYISAATIVFSYMQLITAPLGGITLGGQPILSYNYGANDKARVKKAFNCITICCVIFTTTMFIISLLFGQYFVNIFLLNQTSDPTALINYCHKSIMMYTLGIIILAVQYSSVDSLVGLSKSGLAVSLSLFRKTLIIGLTILIPFVFGIEFIWAAESIGDIISGIISGSVFFIMINKILNDRNNFVLKEAKLSNASSL